MKHVDVVVIGAGSIGAMTLWQLSAHTELNVVGLDAYPRMNLNSSYAGESRLFRIIIKEGEIFNDHVEMSLKLWRTLEDTSSHSILEQCGMLSIGPADIEPIRGFIRDRIHEDGQTSHWFGVPSLDGYSIKIGYYPAPDDDRVDINPDEELQKYSTQQLSHVGEMLQKCIPDLLPSPVRHEMHHDTYASNAMPIFDRLAADDRVIYATGMHGVAFKFTPAYGRMLTDMVANGSSAL